MLTLRSKGDFKNTEKLLKKALGKDYMSVLQKYGRIGVDALASNTPKDTGETAGSWDYEIVEENGAISVRWINRHVEKGTNIALILQYGHGTRHGGYVDGRDYINPSLQPIFDDLADAAWKEVTGI